jgi:hypothetical protein
VVKGCGPLRKGLQVSAVMAGMRGTLRCERLGLCELVAATGEDSLSYEGRFTVKILLD